MMHHAFLQHHFVEHFPEHLAPGVLYVSLEFGSVAHNCCCGCGEEVVTPLTPTDWMITYDGETITLHPSVGNWTLPCRSHYVIRRGKVIEAPPWTDAQVAVERRRDKMAKKRFFGQDVAGEAVVADEPVVVRPDRRSWVDRLRDWWRGEKS